MRRIGPIITAALGVALLLPAAAAADTFEVNRNGDPAPGACTNDHCTLREAVQAATADDGNDRIVLPSTEPYVLKRDSSLPAPDDAKGDLDFGMMFDLTNDFKLVHPGAGLATIDASAANDRAIEVNGFLKLIKVKVTGGESIAGAPGGGISVPHGALLVRNSKIVGNSASNVGGGIYGDDANVIVKKSLLARNDAGAHGGGIYSDPDGRFELDRSTVRDNQAVNGDGGGAWAGTGLFNGASRLVASTLTENEAADDGGGVFVEAESFIALNSTITKNRADGRGGGIYAAPESDSLIDGITIVRNRADADDTAGPDKGGGIFADGGADVVEIANSLLALNREAAGAVNECDVPAPVGIDSVGGNLITTTAGGCDQFDDAEDIVDSQPRIAKLQNAGGPTQTIPLKSGSPAIGEADGPSPQFYDQRGNVRDDDPDIGAYER